MQQQVSTLLKTSLVKSIILNINKIRPQLLIIVAFLPVFLLPHLIPEQFERGNLFISNLFFKVRFRLLEKEKVSSSLKVFTIDDNDIEELGIDKYERERFAAILEILKNARVKTVAFDILFKDRVDERGDNLLVQKTGEAGNIFYPLIVGQAEEATYALTNTTQRILDKATIFPETKRAGPSFYMGNCLVPFYDLAEAARGTGDIRVTSDSDGIVHRVSLIRAYRKGYLPSLVLRGICDFFEVKPGNIQVVFGKHIILPGARYPDDTIKDILIPIDSQGKMMINYSGPWHDSVPPFAIRSLFKAAEEQPEKLEFSLQNTFAIVTDISSINKNVYKGIFESNYPHSGILINAVNTILTGRFMHTPALYESLAGALFCIIILCFFSGKLKAAHFIPASAALGLFIVGINLVLFCYYRRLPDFMPYLAAIFASSSALIVNNLLLFIQDNKKLSSEYQKLSEENLEQKKEITQLRVDSIQSRKSLDEKYSEYGLTKRQKDVINLLKLGKQRKEIAWEMKIEEETVHSHFSNIFKKCNVSSSLELIQLFKE